MNSLSDQNISLQTQQSTNSLLLKAFRFTVCLHH